jgi:hypothetical protein
MPHPSINPVGSVKQVSGVLGAVIVKSTVLRDVERLLRKAGTYVPNYQLAHPLRCNYKCSAVRCKTNEYLHSDTQTRVNFVLWKPNDGENSLFIFSPNIYGITFLFII